jgi:hypothetical protein
MQLFQCFLVFVHLLHTFHWFSVLQGRPSEQFFRRLTVRRNHVPEFFNPCYHVFTYWMEHCRWAESRGGFRCSSISVTNSILRRHHLILAFFVSYDSGVPCISKLFITQFGHDTVNLVCSMLSARISCEWLISHSWFYGLFFWRVIFFKIIR